jgi:hypothetical protein
MAPPSQELEPPAIPGRFSSHGGEFKVAQRISGGYRLITIPTIYKTLMFWLGADRAIKRYVIEVMQPSTGTKALVVGCGPANILPYLPPVDYTASI